MAATPREFKRVPSAASPSKYFMRRRSRDIVVPVLKGSPGTTLTCPSERIHWTQSIEANEEWILCADESRQGPGTFSADRDSFQGEGLVPGANRKEAGT